MRSRLSFAVILSASAIGCGSDDTDPTPSFETATSDGTTSGAEGGEGESAGDGDSATDDSAGDGDGTSGDGDGTSGDGTSGDGDGTSGDGDGTSGDGDGTSGDGDGTGGDGDGDGTSGDGDGTSGDGDGTGGDGDGTSGDGDGTSGDGDGTSGDGDGASGDGDGTSGDGDGTSGDGDGTSGDGDGTTSGDGDGTTGDGDGTGGDGDGDGTTGATGDGDGTPCFVEQPAVTVVPPNVIFVLDKSGSMMEMVNGQNTRWGALHTTVVDVVTTWQAEIAFGAKMFGSRNWALGVIPNNPQQQCSVDNQMEAAPALNNLAAIVAGILPADEYISPYCLTPTQGGFERARDWLVQQVPDENNAIILVTDGFVSDGRPIGGGNAPDCSGNTVPGLTAEIGDMWTTYGWPTYVVGVDIDQSVRDEMNGYADAGGVPTSGNTRFYDTGSGSGLTNALNSIAGSIESCTFEMSVASPSPQYTQVLVNGVEFPQITENQCNTQDGWYYSDAPANLLIELCGVACDDFVSFGSAEVQYFCTAG